VVFDTAHRLGDDRRVPVLRGLDPVAAWRLRRLVAARRPDVLVAHGGEPVKYAALAVAGSDRVLVGHAIGTSPESATRGVRGASYRALWHRCDLVVAVSTDVAAHLERDLGVPAGLVRVIPNGRDVAAYPEPTPRQDGPLRLIFVGELTGTKRPQLFLDVVQELRARGREVEGVVVGTGPLEAAIRRRGGHLGVTVLGRRDDVPALLAGASVFVFPSAPEGEGMPGVLIEAGLAGLPTVATDVAGARDVVLDGKTGRVVAHDDPGSLIDAVDALACSRESREEMGRAARTHCATHFGLDASIAAWVDLLGALRQDRRSRGAT
jgi:glycosyltransferase involved in cell wall biosynthesis